MDKERKIKCDCGEFLARKEAEFEHVLSEAMVCQKCGFVMLTKGQAQKLIRLKQLHHIVDSERKIIRIGNSMGLTLPEQMQQFGAKVGRKVKIEALTLQSFKVEIV